MNLKYTYILLAFMLFSVCCFSQKINKEVYLKVEVFEKDNSKEKIKGAKIEYKPYPHERYRELIGETPSDGISHIKLPFDAILISIKVKKEGYEDYENEFKVPENPPREIIIPMIPLKKRWSIKAINQKNKDKKVGETLLNIFYKGGRLIKTTSPQGQLLVSIPSNIDSITIKVEKKGYDFYNEPHLYQEQIIDGEKRKSIIVELIKKPTINQTIYITSFGAAVTCFGISELYRSNYRTNCQGIPNHQCRVTHYKDTANILLILSGLKLVASGIFYCRHRKSNKEHENNISFNLEALPPLTTNAQITPMLKISYTFKN